MSDLVADRIDEIYRSDSRQVLATLIRLLGDFDLAEEALHDAFMAALERWPNDGMPRNPRAWLVSTGRFKAIDRVRRRVSFDAAVSRFGEADDTVVSPLPDEDDDSVPDDRLRLLFTCCHPALSPDAQIALTLREVCGLTTEEVARAFLTPPPTVAQRRAHSPRASRSLTVESRSDRRGYQLGRTGVVVAPCWALRAAGGDRRRACRSA